MESIEKPFQVHGESPTGDDGNRLRTEHGTLALAEKSLRTLGRRGFTDLHIVTTGGEEEPVVIGHIELGANGVRVRGLR